jgi:hypothetical protein
MRQSWAYLAAVICIAGFAVYLALQPPAAGPTGLRYLAVPTAMALPTPTPPAAALEGRTWQLDFSASGLSDTVAACEQCSLGSSLSFRDGEFSGNIGAGAGCDSFGGRYYAPNSLIQLFVAPPVSGGCYPDRVQEIHFRLTLAHSYALTGCPSSACELRLMDHEGNAVLVYRLGEG